MKRKGLWLAGAALAGLLALSPEANAGVWMGCRGMPRHEVVFVHPGRFWVARHRAWNGWRYGWMPGRWIVRYPGHFHGEGRWEFRHERRGFHGYDWR